MCVLNEVNVMKKWVEIRKATLLLDQYAVVGSRLVDDAYYGEDGMSDVRSTLPLDEYMLDVYSWGIDQRGDKIASSAWSKIRFTAKFKNKDDANKAWLKIKKERPSWKEIKCMGFCRVQ